MAEPPPAAPTGAAASGQDLLLATKLHVPGPQPGFVTRPRVAETLGEGLAQGLALVCAPAGFGKTALLAHWARSGDRQTVLRDPPLGGYANERTVEALGPLLGYLRALGAAPLPPAEPVTETGQLLDRFGAYLASERGLAPRTVALNVRLARPFLQQRALERDGRLDLDQLTAAEVRAFVLDQARKQPRSAKRVVTALRSLAPLPARRWRHYRAAGGRRAVGRLRGRGVGRAGRGAGRKMCDPRRRRGRSRPR